MSGQRENALTLGEMLQLAEAAAHNAGITVEQGTSAVAAVAAFLVEKGRLQERAQADGIAATFITTDERRPQSYFRALDTPTLRFVPADGGRPRINWAQAALGFASGYCAVSLAILAVRGIVWFVTR